MKGVGEISEEVDASLVWSFDPKSGVDAPFISIVSAFGASSIFTLDELILLPPLQAATEAVKHFFTMKSQLIEDQEEVANQTRELMNTFKTALEKQSELNGRIREDALLPPESLYTGQTMNSPSGETL